jgi:hypothetical protein
MRRPCAKAAICDTSSFAQITHRATDTAKTIQTLAG